MIVLCTDLGLSGPYLGQMQAVLARQAPGVSVINLFADLPPFNARAAAYLLAAYSQEFAAGTVFLCVVDPGVGSMRKPLALLADERWFVGPDNGMLDIVARRAQQTQRWAITYSPPHLSATFHGRDLFAPVAAQLATGLPVPGKRLSESGVPGEAWPDDLFEIVYIDHYGNAMTGVRACMVDKSVQLLIEGRALNYARTFSEVPIGETFWYENANGLVEIAARQASAARMLGLSVSDGLAVV